MPVEQPLEEGARRRRRIDLPRRGSLLREGMKGDVRIARPPASSSKAEPRDLNVIATFCIGEETQKFFCRIVISQSSFYRCARKISRFARNDDMGGKMTIRGMMGCGGAVFSFPYPRRLAANYFPLFLRSLLSCDIMTLLGENAFAECRVFFAFMNP